MPILGRDTRTHGRPAPYRKPAPLEDHGPQIEEPVFGACAGLEGTDQSFWVMEWIAKRIWFVLGLDYNETDRQGPPEMKVDKSGDWITVQGTITDGGMPLRNQVISAEVEQVDAPLLIVLRSTDAFGEVFIELDLKQGTAVARCNTVNRGMKGGLCHSSPMPHESNSHIFRSLDFEPAKPKGTLRIRTQGERITFWFNDRELFRLDDPDPAGGKFGFGSTGTMKFRNAQQWELITREEKNRREACIAEIHQFCKDLDTWYDDDVRARNTVTQTAEGLSWKWNATGAAAHFRADGPLIKATVTPGLYGNDTLVDGVFPEIEIVSKTGATYTTDPDGKASADGDALGIHLTLPLKSKSGKKAKARVHIKTTVQTSWFWTVTVEGAEAKEVRAFLELAPAFVPKREDLEHNPDRMFGVKPLAGKALLRTNYKVGFYLKCTLPETTTMSLRKGRKKDLAVTSTEDSLKFATVILPAQPLNMVGFKHRMVHYIRYPEGPVQHWRRAPSYQEYPADVDLLRYQSHGTDAMVWHHTWIGDDYRDHEGFKVNHAEMSRAMQETHRLGMKMIGYLGIVPGRNSLLRFEDTCPLGGGNTYGGYDKNWDLQDFTFYHVNGRYPEFLAWLTDYLCKEYGMDGYYLDGGSFGAMGYGGVSRDPYHPEDKGLTLEEIRHRTYYRIRKVFELNQAGYGLEPWSGLDYMLNGFYDCMMIGESFQEAAPEYYRDGHNALLTGCMIKMYGMRDTSQNPYNIAMAAVNLSDIQVCSGNKAWGNEFDDAHTWERVRPLWTLLDSIDWDNLVEARPWYGQELVSGEGFYAGNYTEKRRAIVFLANQTERKRKVKVRIDPAKLPEIDGEWHVRYCLGREGDLGTLGDGEITVELPKLHDGPIGIELTAM